MSIPAGPEITIKQGDTYCMTATVTDGTNPIDITNWTITFYAKETPLSTPTLTKAFTITDGPAGEATLNLATTDTADLADDKTHNTYSYEVVFQNADDSIVKTYTATLEVYS